MTDITPKPPDGGKPFLDLRIQLDSAHQVISISLNDTPLEFNKSGLLEQPAAEDCCSSSADSVKPDVRLAPAAAETVSAAPRALEYLLRLFRNAFLTLLAIIGVQLLILHYYLDYDTGFLGRYGWWILYLDISVVSLAAALGYLRSYVYDNVHHMVGMLVGMIIGMQVGTMIGGVLGATNGFFMGSIVGMALGSLCGVASAWCCGPMAVMHGLMAGVMGGIMGAMAVVMMIPDHVLIFMPIFTAANLLILIWFAYLFYKECVVADRCPVKKTISLPSLLGVSALTVGFLTALMISGPKGAMIWKGPKRPPADGATASNPFSIKDGVIPDQPDDQPAGEMVCGAMMMEPVQPLGETPSESPENHH